MGTAEGCITGIGNQESEALLDRFRELSEPVVASAHVGEMSRYTQHGQTSTLDHTLAVAYLSLALARRLGLSVDEPSLVRGAILHDYYLYDWHDHEAAPDRWHGFTHPGHALANAERDFPDLTERERDLIVHHMFPLTPIPPRHREGVLVCLADKVATVAEVLLQSPYRREATHA